ncbi:uncharacterized protein [Diabrotica undecimpunctata]|uniref:uncharacterized protein n=1 Tax=Diabrotica undecimpunctata TaxID=50387 RepID=UPI003B63989D
MLIFLLVPVCFKLKYYLNMTSKHVLLFSAIAEFFKNDMSQLQRGENSYESGNVLKFIFDSEVFPALLKGEVRASMKNKNYSVEVSIDYDDGIVDAKCSCPRGQVVCHHMAALCLHAHHNISITDKACAWNKRKAVDIETVTKIRDIYEPKRSNYVAVQRTANQEEIENFKEGLGHANPTGFAWLLMPEPLPEANLLPSIDTILFSESYMNASDKEEFFLKECRVTQSLIRSVHDMTIGQAYNQNWLIARKYRLTSSKFGPVIAAYNRGKYPKSLFTNLLEGYDLNGVQAIQWGRENERCALSKFSEVTGLDIEPAGFCLHENGFLGTSPDGYVNKHFYLNIL